MTNTDRNSRIIEYYDLVPKIAARLRRQLPANVEMDELISAGTVGLIEAVDRYDPRVGELKAYVEIRVRGAMVDMVRRNGWVPRSVRSKARVIEDARRSFTVLNGRRPDRNETADRMGMSTNEFIRLETQAHARHLVSLDTPINEDESSTVAETIPANQPPADDVLAERREKELLENAVQRLDERSRMVITLCFNRGLTLREVGDMLGVTESRVCQIRGQAVKKLRAITWMEQQSALQDVRKAA